MLLQTYILSYFKSLIIISSISSQEYFTPRIVDPAVSGICPNVIKQNKIVSNVKVTFVCNNLINLFEN